MWKDSYVENQVFTAGPMDLVRMLYRGAIDSVREARRRLAAGEIMERSKAINRAVAILGELSASLDHAGGGEVSRNLVELYAYILRLLMRANLQQEDAPLQQAESLLSTLSEGWERAAAEPGDAPGASSVYPPQGENVAEYAHSWSA